MKKHSFNTKQDRKRSKAAKERTLRRKNERRRKQERY